jgi:hypothetical protein
MERTECAHLEWFITHLALPHPFGDRVIDYLAIYLVEFPTMFGRGCHES